ncbi:unnamed protein product [Prorocentrum cordatum]|uniref:Uncharacterized protein n=1 Tax=Prorocentrum cordatum TaxID=2364126 RepID=A0ABN9S6P9_9DINO|nr:unnamed protein product [Polarella glacialis]
MPLRAREMEEDSNPFEGAFSMIKDMRVQVHKMQAHLEDEKRERTNEAARLRQEVESLKARLAQEAMEKTTLCHKLGEGLVEAKARHSRQGEAEGARFADEVAAEARVRQAAVQAISERLSGAAAQVARLENDCMSLRQDVEKLDSSSQAECVELRGLVREHSHGLQRIQGVLRRVGAAWAMEAGPVAASEHYGDPDALQRGRKDPISAETSVPPSPWTTSLGGSRWRTTSAGGVRQGPAVAAGRQGRPLSPGLAGTLESSGLGGRSPETVASEGAPCAGGRRGIHSDERQLVDEMCSMLGKLDGHVGDARSDRFVDHRHRRS